MNVHSMSAPLSTSDPSDKREAILDAALALFSERGFHGTAVPLVAERAKVGAGTIYRYFPSKEALVNAVYQRSKRLIATALFDDFPFEAPTRAQLKAFWRRASAFAKNHRRDLEFCELHHHEDYLDDESRALERIVLAPAEAFFAAGQEAQVIRAGDPIVLGALVWGAFVGLARASWEGRLTLDEATIALAEESCWGAIRA